MILINYNEVDIIKFPNNEVLIKNKDFTKLELSKGDLHIRFKFETNEDLINLMFLKKYFDDSRSKKKCHLKILYMPYSRMDRTEGTSVFTLKYVSQFINDLNFETVEVYEPHSDVTMALLDRATQVNMTKTVVNNVRFMLDFRDSSDKNDYLFFPDAGAEKRYSKQFKFKNILSANKERDFETGDIKKLTITGEIPKEPFRVIIVDDLCSKGGTFMLSASKLKEIGATEIYLAITHCENTIHDGSILKTDLIDKVYTTNSLLTNYASDKIEIVKDLLSSGYISE